MNNKKKTCLKKSRINDLLEKYYLNDLARGNIIFVTTDVPNDSTVSDIKITNKEILTE